MACVGLLGSTRAAAGPAVPARAPANGSRVTGVVLRQTLLTDATPAMEQAQDDRDRARMVWSLRIDSAEPRNAGMANLAPVGATVDVYATTVPATDLTGRTITAILELRGDTLGVRWWLVELSPPH